MSETSSSPAPWPQGKVQVYTGDGKGKTTAAAGLALRALASGRRVYFAQFLKDAPSGEIAALSAHYPERFVTERFGTGRFVRKAPSAEERRRIRAGLAAAAAQLAEGNYDLVVFDEIHVAARLGLVTVEEVLDAIVRRPAGVELVLTGRDADPRVIERADLVTEMRALKHYYGQGLAAREGIES